MKTARRSDAAWIESPDNVELNTDCTICGAATGYSCRDRAGVPVLRNFHLMRLRALRAAAIVITKGGKGRGEMPARIHPAHVLAFVVMALLGLGCGGRPFTVDDALAMDLDAEVLDANAPAEDRRALVVEGGSAPDGGGDPEGSTLPDAGAESGPPVDAHEVSDAHDHDAEVADAGAEAAPIDAAPSLCCVTAAPCPDKSIPVPLPSSYGGWSGTTSGSQCMPGVPGYGYCSGTVGVCP